MEMSRCILFEKKLPRFLWAEAVNTSVYLLNRLQTKYVQSKTHWKYGLVSNLLPNTSKCLDHCVTFRCYLSREANLMKELRKEFLLDMRQNLQSEWS